MEGKRVEGSREGRLEGRRLEGGIEGEESQGE